MQTTRCADQASPPKETTGDQAVAPASFTPGPWGFLEVDDHDDEINAGRPLTIYSPSYDDLANVYSRDDATVSIPREQAVANARLIAAAPELYEALKELLALTDDPSNNADPEESVFAFARAALAKVQS